MLEPGTYEIWAIREDGTSTPNQVVEVKYEPYVEAQRVDLAFLPRRMSKSRDRSLNNVN